MPRLTLESMWELVELMLIHYEKYNDALRPVTILASINEHPGTISSMIKICYYLNWLKSSFKSQTREDGTLPGTSTVFRLIILLRKVDRYVYSWKSYCNKRRTILDSFSVNEQMMDYTLMIQGESLSRVWCVELYIPKGRRRHGIPCHIKSTIPHSFHNFRCTQDCSSWSVRIDAR